MRAGEATAKKKHIDAKWLGGRLWVRMAWTPTLTLPLVPCMISADQETSIILGNLHKIGSSFIPYLWPLLEVSDGTVIRHPAPCLAGRESKTVALIFIIASFLHVWSSEGGVRPFCHLRSCLWGSLAQAK